MKSFLDVQGIYDPTLRFAFTNITEEDFISAWDKVPITVKPGTTIEVSNTTPIPGAGHALAIKMTGEMVDSIMIGKAKLDEVAYYKANPGMQPNAYRAPSSLGVPAARKVWEDQILRSLTPDEESPAIQTMRKQIIEEITQSTQKQDVQPVHVPTSLNEFAELGKPQEVVVKKSAKTKEVK